jgi:uncharacterized protein (DUF433 family)
MQDRPLPHPIKWRERITFDAGKRAGQPCICGVRITVNDVLEYLASGMSYSEILQDFPELSQEDIQACLAFAAEQGRRTRFAAFDV